MINFEGKKMEKERDYYFDNLKAVLIFLVVLGHFLLPIHDDNFLVNLKRLIYVFHMPLFIFVSGYFSKSIYKNGKYNFEKILYFLKAYIIFVVAIQIVYALFHYRKFSDINFFKQSGAPWYMFAMMTWYLLIPVVKKMKPTLVFAISIPLALIVGYFDSVGDVLCLSRILVFGPFFFLGFFMDKDSLAKAMNKKFCLPVIALAVMLGAFFLRFGTKIKDEMEMVYQNIPYSDLDHYWAGPLVRLFFMASALVMSWALMFFIPKGKTQISIIGQRTMPIYMLHRLIRDVLKFCGLYDYLDDVSAFTLPLLICLTICFTYICAQDAPNKFINEMLRLKLTPKLLKLRK